MNVPGIAKQTFEELKHLPEFMDIVKALLEKLKKFRRPEDRAEFIHQTIDQYNQEVFSHPLVQQLSPCKMGCSACCHTQVSVTDDEAILLAQKIQEGVEIDWDRLKIQMSAKNITEEFFKLSYQDRKCIFLDENGLCKVYRDRPSVCRTNAVLGSPSQCDTTLTRQKTRLVRTPKADLAIYGSYLFAKSSGTLPLMVGELLDVKAELE